VTLSSHRIAPAGRVAGEAPEMLGIDFSHPQALGGDCSDRAYMPGPFTTTEFNVPPVLWRQAICRFVAFASFAMDFAEYLFKELFDKDLYCHHLTLERAEHSCELNPSLYRNLNSLCHLEIVEASLLAFGNEVFPCSTIVYGQKSHQDHVCSNTGFAQNPNLSGRMCPCTFIVPIDDWRIVSILGQLRTFHRGESVAMDGELIHCGHTFRGDERGAHPAIHFHLDSKFIERHKSDISVGASSNLNPLYTMQESLETVFDLLDNHYWKARDFWKSIKVHEGSLMDHYKNVIQVSGTTEEKEHWRRLMEYFSSMNKHVFNYEMTEMQNYANSMIYTALKQDPKNKQAWSLLSTRNFKKVIKYDSSGELEEEFPDDFPARPRSKRKERNYKQEPTATTNVNNSTNELSNKPDSSYSSDDLPARPRSK
jgi:hypothetical protein